MSEEAQETQETQTPAWTVVAVCPTEDDPIEAFLYTDGLWERYGRAELWVSWLGQCGHRVSVHGAHFVMNRLADRVILGELGPGDSHDEPFNDDAVLTFTLGAVDPDGREKYQTYCAPDDAPVQPVTWRCCAGKET